MNKLIGKIIKYNGSSGLIVDENNNQYLLLNHNIVGNEKINVDDIVSFLPEVFKTIEIEEKVATFIEKCNS